MDVELRRRRGCVHLVGAGPGDPELLTRKAERLLACADVVAYDELVPEAIVALAHRDAERIAVGRRANGRRHHEGQLHPLVLQRAREGKMVVRLKGGDPMIFGRGGEEARVLADAGVPFEVVPGVTAALGAAATRALPLTLREVASMVTLATAHPAKDDAAWPQKLAAQVPAEGTLALYMGIGALPAVARALAVRRGEGCPAMVVSHASLPSERAVVGTLADIAQRVRQAALPLPALVIVGEVVDHAVAQTRRTALPARPPRASVAVLSLPW